MGCCSAKEYDADGKQSGPELSETSSLVTETISSSDRLVKTGVDDKTSAESRRLMAMVNEDDSSSSSIENQRQHPAEQQETDKQPNIELENVELRMKDSNNEITERMDTLEDDVPLMEEEFTPLIDEQDPWVTAEEEETNEVMELLPLQHEIDDLKIKEDKDEEETEQSVERDHSHIDDDDFIPRLDAKEEHLRRLTLLIRHIVRESFADQLIIINEEVLSFLLMKESRVMSVIHRYGYSVSYPRGYHTLGGHERSVMSCVISDDGCFLFSGSLEGRIICWDLRSNNMMDQWQAAHDYPINHLCFGYGNLVSCALDFSVKLWDAHQHSEHQPLLTLDGHEGRVTLVHFTHNGQVLVTASEDRSIRAWSAQNGRCLNKFAMDAINHTLSRNTVMTLRDLNHPESMMLAAIHYGRRSVESCTLGLNFNELSELRELVGPLSTEFNLSSMLVNFDQSLMLVFFSDDNCNLAMKVRLDPETKRVMEQTMVEFDPDQVTADSQYCWHPSDPDVIAVAANDSKGKSHSINVFRMRDCSSDGSSAVECIDTLVGHSNLVNDLCFTPDGFCLVSVSEDMTVRVWEVAHL